MTDSNEELLDEARQMLDSMVPSGFPRAQTVNKPEQNVSQSDLEDPGYLAELLQHNSQITVTEKGAKYYVIEYILSQPERIILEVFAALGMETLRTSMDNLTALLWFFNVTNAEIIQSEDVVNELAYPENSDVLRDLVAAYMTPGFGYAEWLFSALTGTVVHDAFDEKQFKLPYEEVKTYDRRAVINLALRTHGALTSEARTVGRTISYLPTVIPPYLLLALQGLIGVDTAVINFYTAGGPDSPQNNELAQQGAQAVGMIIPPNVVAARRASSYFLNNVLDYQSALTRPRDISLPPSRKEFTNSETRNQAFEKLKYYSDLELISYYELRDITWNSRTEMRNEIFRLQAAPVSVVTPEVLEEYPYAEEEE